MRSELRDRLVIRTPEGIEFSHTLAGPVTRLLARIIDTVVVQALNMVVNIPLSVIAAFSPSVAMALIVVSGFVLTFGYSILLEWRWRGKTVGKHIMKLRVIDASGLNLQLNQIVVRNLLRAIDILPALYLVGGVSCIVSRYNQRLGDLAANTIVIRNRRIGAPDLSQLLAGKYNSFREYGHLAARLRQQASPQAANLAVEALMRRDELDPEARVALFAEIADHFRELAEFPPEATDGLSDEQYVRNVADLLFRERTAVG